MSTASDFDIAARFSYLCVQAEVYFYLYYHYLYSEMLGFFFFFSPRVLNTYVLKYNIQFSSLLSI